MAIELKGFYPRHDNKVYGRPGKFGEIDVEEVVLLERYHTPSEDDVVLFLQAMAREALRSPTLVGPDGKKLTAGSDLEVILKKLPDKIIRSIASGEKECIQFIKRNTSALPLEKKQKPDNYFDIDYGMIPRKVISANKDNARDYRWYHHAFRLDNLLAIGMGGIFTIRFRYNPHFGVIINRNELDILRKHKTTASHSFSLLDPYHHNAVAEVLDSAYENLSGAASIELLPDHSQIRLDLCVIDSLKALHEVAVANILQQTIEGNAGVGRRMRRTN